MNNPLKAFLIGAGITAGMVLWLAIAVVVPVGLFTLVQDASFLIQSLWFGALLIWIGGISVATVSALGIHGLDLSPSRRPVAPPPPSFTDR